MEVTSKSVSKFVAATIAFLTGDSDTATALKNERLAQASIKGQLSALEGALVNAEVDVENAKENLTKAIYPTVLISNQQGYYNNIVGAQSKLDDAEEALANIKKSIDYAQALLKDKF
jgi:outer membrane protein TolC